MWSCRLCPSAYKKRDIRILQEILLRKYQWGLSILWSLTVLRKETGQWQTPQQNNSTELLHFPISRFFFFPRFVLFALAGNKLQYDVCQTEKQRNSSLNKSEPLSSAGMLRSDPKLLLTRMVWFWPHPNFCPCKLSHRCHIKQLKWKTTPDVRLLLLHEIETALRFQENSTNSSPDMTPVGQTLPWPVATRTPCSRPRWPIWWEGVQPVPSHRW